MAPPADRAVQSGVTFATAPLVRSGTKRRKQFPRAHPGFVAWRGYGFRPLSFRPIAFRKVLCAPLCMFNGPQDAIEAVAPLTERGPLPRKRDRERFCATASWGVEQCGDLAQRKAQVPQHQNPLEAAEILVAVEPIACLRTMRGRQQLEPVVVMQCAYSNAGKFCELLDAEGAHGSHLRHV